MAGRPGLLDCLIELAFGFLVKALWTLALWLQIQPCILDAVMEPHSGEARENAQGRGDVYIPFLFPSQLNSRKDDIIPASD